MQSIIEVTRENIEALKTKAQDAILGRARICLHESVNDLVHEMIIAFRRNSYVVPHKHINKSESFHILEGKAAVFIFDDNGAVQRIINMGEYHTGLTNTYRLNESLWHTVIPMTEMLVLKEVTTGPFIKSEAHSAIWAPDGSDKSSAYNYVNKLIKLVDTRIFL